MTKQAINELKQALMTVKSDNTDSFRHSDLYKMLKNELARLGYWKLKARGNAKKGYENSPIMQDRSHQLAANMNSNIDKL